MNRNGGWQSWAKLGAFGTAGVLSAVLVMNTLSVPVRGNTVTYQAQFTSVEGLNAGNPVTMNGIRIG
ncbi:MlaD family protein, partial [Mycolicibacterium sp.]